MKYNVTVEVRQRNVEASTPIDAAEKVANSLSIGLLRVKPNFGCLKVVDENGTTFLYNDEEDLRS